MYAKSLLAMLAVAAVYPFQATCSPVEGSGIGLAGVKVVERGIISFGPDNVVRSFGSDLSLVDSRTLSPEQSQELASRYIKQSEARGVEVPDYLHRLARSEEVTSVEDEHVRKFIRDLPAEKYARSAGNDMSAPKGSILERGLRRRACPIDCGSGCPSGCYCGALFGSSNPTCLENF